MPTPGMSSAASPWARCRAASPWCPIPTALPSEAWVLNAVANTVSLLDVSSTDSPSLTATITLEDPTDAEIKQGRIAFNDADASSTGTFSCESCHPDGHTDQLTWVLATPVCDVEGCTQIPPRLTMPVRGLRNTAPYHWDGIPGDPYGGRNTSSINADVEPNCSADDPLSCTRHLVDGSMATTMCDQGDCATNDEDKAGLLDAEDRDALARFLLSVPYPPAPDRPVDNVLTDAARDGFFEFSFINDSGKTTGAQTCGACHRPPFLVSTNTPGTGMDAPTWRGAYDRWMMLPQGRLNIIDLMTIVRMDDTFPERDMWILAGASSDIWQMVRQGSTGFHGSFARQLTLNSDTAQASETVKMQNALQRAASDGAIVLRGEGAVLRREGAPADEASTVKPVSMVYRNGRYEALTGSGVWGSHKLRQRAGAGEMVVTLTAHAGRASASTTSSPRCGPSRPSRRRPATWTSPSSPTRPPCASTEGISTRMRPSSSTAARSTARSAARSAPCRTATTRSSWRS